MKTVSCRICGKFFKKRRINRSIEWCEVCRQLVCRDHITDVVTKVKIVPRPYAIEKEVHTRTCKLCIAERALTA